MKKQYKLSIEYDDDTIDEVDSLSEILDEIGEEGILLDMGDTTILLPPELAVCLEKSGILGLA